MPTTDFASEILETEIVLTHIEDGHVFHFPILSNGIVSLRGTRIDANPKAKCEGSSISSTRVTRRRRRSGAHIRSEWSKEAPQSRTFWSNPVTRLEDKTPWQERSGYSFAGTSEVINYSSALVCRPAPRDRLLQPRLRWDRPLSNPFRRQLVHPQSRSARSAWSDPHITERHCS
jgi:hypothetical protein